MKKCLSVVITGLCLSLSLPSFADEVEKKPAPATGEQTAPRLTEKPKQVQTLPEVEAALQTAIDGYVKAWQAQDFKTLRNMESWEGGEEPSELRYLQAFDADFQIYEWKITRVEPQENGQIKILVWIKHNVNKQFAALAPDVKSVNSTLIQWWKKEGDKYVHLFNIERQNLMNMMPTLPTTPPTIDKEEGDKKPEPKAEEPKDEKPTEEPKKI